MEAPLVGDGTHLTATDWDHALARAAVFQDLPQRVGCGRSRDGQKTKDKDKPPRTHRSTGMQLGGHAPGLRLPRGTERRLQRSCRANGAKDATFSALYFCV